jgi:pSer/pThr/pTyr-binding forkhead associated (FHA) protein
MIENLPGYLLLSLRLILIIVLYIFLGWSIRIIWKEMKHTAESITTKQTPPIILTVDQEATNPISYTRNEIIIGRSPICDLHIQDETVSSRHGQIFYRHNQWWYEDLGSSNGSFINELDVDTPIVLTDGDRLRLGKISIEITFT